jgi:hypothetical protein
MDVQDQNESSQTITVATQDGVDMRFNSAELIQSVNSVGAFDNLSKNYIEPAVKTLMSTIEADFLAFATKATYNVAGTAGSAINSLVAPGAARAKLNQGLAPKDRNRCIQMDSVTMGGLVNGVAAYFNPANAIGEQFREGLVSRTGMADFYENERVWTMTNGADVTGTVNAASLVTDGGNLIGIHSTIAQADQVVGMVFTVAGVYALHPETKQAYGHLQQFSIQATGGAGGTTVSPTIYLTGAKKNVGSSTGADITAATFNSAALTFVGAASTNYAQSLMYHKEAFQFITADLPIMDDAHKCVRHQSDGLSVRAWMASDIRNDELLLRLDILYGMAALRPAWASRMIGSASA